MFKDGRGSGLCKNENYANHADSQVKWKLLESDEVKVKPKAMISFTVESSWFINIHIDFSETYYSDSPHRSLYYHLSWLGALGRHVMQMLQMQQNIEIL